MRTVPEEHFDHSGGIQGATSWLLRAQNEVEDAVNARFDDEIGVITRRNGYEQEGQTLESGKNGLGLHEARFSTGAKFLAAINNAGDTQTVIKSLNYGTGAWTNLTLPATLDEDAEINFSDSLGETYAAGLTEAGVPLDMINIKNDLTTSATRNLINAPKARFVTEYGGRLYAMNVEVDSTHYPDRAYRSSPATSTVTFMRGSQSASSTNVLAVDSVRYLKAGMAIDIYSHTSGSALYSNVTISSVDKGEDTITLPAISGALTFTTGNVNTGTDVITLSSTTNFPTGTPVVITSTTTVPAPLVSDSVYYVINASGTTIKLATTAANATAGTAIDITSTGTGTHTIHLLYTVSDNDEVYLTGRKGEMCYLWNTDYPTEDKSDFIKIPSGAATNSAIVGYGKSNSRLFMFTDSTVHKWDGAQLITRYDDVGCADHDTIKNIGDWMIWLDSETRVNAYNDSTGQHEFISRAIHKQWLKDIPSSNYTSCAAGAIGNIYKLHLGTVDGDILRFCYDFDANNWARETHTRNMLKHVSSDISGYKKLYFLDNTGKLYVDDTGDLDDTTTIPFMVRYGRNNSGTIFAKTYTGYYIIGQNLSGTRVRVYINGRPDPIELTATKLEDGYLQATVGNKTVSGRDITLEVSHNGKGSPIAIEGYVPFLAAEETKFG